MSKREIIVSKFGGSSMTSFEVMCKAAEIIRREESNFVVVSAVFKTTDELGYLIEQAELKNWSECVKKIFALQEKHFDITNALKSSQELNAVLKDYFLELEAIIHGISLLGECTPQAKDKILSFGEQLSSTIFNQILKELYPNKITVLLDAREFITTDDYFNEAEPLIDEIKSNFSKLDLDNTIYLTQGFIGSTRDKKTTTLGRGGSDYTAALIAEATNASLLQIWTDVDGIKTTDPRICKTSKRIHEITYNEASEFAYLGAKVLHPITLTPCKRANIPIFIGSTIIDNSKGTKILKAPKDSPVVRGISLMTDMIKVVLENSAHLKRHEFLRRIINTLEEHKIELMGLNITDKNIAFFVKKEKLGNPQIINTFNQYGQTSTLINQSLISIIGNDLNQKKIIEIVNNQIDITSIIHTASENSITMVCHSTDAKKIINSLHDKHCLHGVNP